MWSLSQNFVALLLIFSNTNIDQWLIVTADLQTLAYLFTMPVMNASESSESLLSDILLLRTKKITVKQ